MRKILAGVVIVMGGIDSIARKMNLEQAAHGEFAFMLEDSKSHRMYDAKQFQARGERKLIRMKHDKRKK